MSEDRDIVLFRIDRKTGILMLAALGVVLGGFALAEQLTLTTSYPVPSGIYTQLVTTGGTSAAPVNTTFNQNAGNTILVPAATNPGGKVGIGTPSPATTLDVNGGIRPGSTGVATGGSCASQPEGTLAYDKTAHTPVYCNNSGVWSAPPSGVIRCNHSGNDVLGGNTVIFSAADCGGVLPDGNYYGALNAARINGGSVGVANVIDVDNGGPGIWFWDGTGDPANVPGAYWVGVTFIKFR